MKNKFKMTLMATTLVAGLSTASLVSASEMTKTTELPKAMIIDADMDMEKTMKFMKKAFKKLGKADDVVEMATPAQSLADYAGQAVLIAENAPADIREDLKKGLTKMRQNVAELQAMIEAGNYKAAKKVVKRLNEQRKKAHKYFDVD